jgi:hypothetical protein
MFMANAKVGTHVQEGVGYRLVVTNAFLSEFLRMPAVCKASV